MNEQQLSTYLVEWLKRDGWDVYQEVESVGGIADIVALKNNILWTIECKNSLTLAVLEQSLNWLNKSHFVSVYVPQKKKVKGYRAALTLLVDNGIGLIKYSNMLISPGIHVELKPKLNRKISKSLFNSLHEEQKSFAPAGNSKGSRWTPFKQTCINLYSEVKTNPGLTLKEYIDTIKHHYRSDPTAISCISGYIKSGVIQNIDIVNENGKLKLYPKE